MDGPICGDALRASGTRTRVKIREDWVIRRKPFPVCYRGRGLLRDYTGRDCDVQDIVQPANPRRRAVRESLMLDAKQRAAGSSPAGGIYFLVFENPNMAALVQLVRTPDCGSGGRGFESHMPPQLLNIIGR